MTDDHAVTAASVTAVDIPAILQRLCDDTATFPPLRASLGDALGWHVGHSRAGHRKLLGPLVVPGDRVEELVGLAAHLPARSLWAAVAVTCPAEVGEALRLLTTIPAVRLAGLEVGLPESVDPARLVSGIAAGLDHADITDTEVYVEVPQDERRLRVLDALADSDFDANLSVVGPELTTHARSIDAPPDAGTPRPLGAAEVAEDVLDVVSRHLPFKVRAGLHHALSSTDPRTGVDRHGFLNLLLAVDAARQGIDSEQNGLRERIETTLVDRDADGIVRRVRALGPERAVAVRASFTSLGTPSFLVPLAELVGLGLVDHQGAR